jgi:hypothetical protein
VADLTLEVARELAGSLVTIGHPYAQAAVNATALDLMKWCKGRLLDGRIVTPEKQAEDLVDVARAWPEGWPEKGGTAKLRALFVEMFPAPETATEPPAITIGELVATGRMAPPCEHCGAGETHCPYGGAKAHARYLPDGIFGPRQHELALAELRARKLVKLDTPGGVN